MSVESDRPSGTDPAERGHANAGAGDAAAAETVLAALRRTHLIHSWQPAGNAFALVVGRGTVSVPPLDAAGVLRLATNLRRDLVKVTGRGYPIGHRAIRYELSDGRFADRYDSRRDRYLHDYPYTVYLPGGDPSGCAAVDFAARTMIEVQALAGVTRVRGECTQCGSHRPLNVRRWQPDPAIPCPGCGAGAVTPVVLLCRGCGHPILRNNKPGFRSAWLHSASGHALCAPGAHDSGSFRDRSQARP